MSITVYCLNLHSTQIGKHIRESLYIISVQILISTLVAKATPINHGVYYDAKSEEAEGSKMQFLRFLAQGRADS